MVKCVIRHVIIIGNASIAELKALLKHVEIR